MLQSKIIWPSFPLRPYIHHYWIMRAWGNSMEMNIMPMGNMKWMLHRGTPFHINGIFDPRNVASICGQYNSAVQVGMYDDCNIIYVFFHPYAMKMITGIPCHLFEDKNISMDDLGIPAFQLLKRMVLDAESDEKAIAYIEDFIIRQLAYRDRDSHLKQLMFVCDEINKHSFATLNQLADKACLSERQLRRVFLDNVGLSPKLMLRTRRCLQASKMIQDMTTKDFTQLTFELGFTDHSHMYKEFKQFAGMSPSEYFDHVNEIRRHHLIKGYKAYHG